MAALSSTFGNVRPGDIAIIWCYDIVCLAFIDALKMYIYGLFDENQEVLPDQEETNGSISEKTGDVEERVGSEAGAKSKGEHQAERLSEWAVRHSERLSRMSHAERASMADKGGRMKTIDRERASLSNMSARVSVASHSGSVSKAYEGAGRPSLMSNNLRPNVPQNMRKF